MCCKMCNDIFQHMQFKRMGYIEKNFNGKKNKSLHWTMYVLKANINHKGNRIFYSLQVFRCI
jgi:hypothetical protein